MRDLLLFWRHRFKKKEFQNLAPGIKICDRGSLSLLGSPIFDQGFKNTIEKTIIAVENPLNKAEFLSRHVAYTLIKNCLFKYSSIISSNYIFKGLAFETLDPWCKETIDFINGIGNRLIAESGDSKSKQFLFERIPLAIQRGNAASIRGMLCM
jgi:hypothetical protein